MLPKSPADSPQSGFFDITHQLELSHPLLALGDAINWSELEKTFACHYSKKGRGAKPIRLMCGLLILKQMFDLSDKQVVEQWMMNPYYQVFCGEVEFQITPPCDSSELSVFRQRIGPQGADKLFSLSVALHGEQAEEKTVLVDTTVQEKAITYPTDSKLAIKIINRLHKLAKRENIKLRRTYAKEIKSLRLASRHFRHAKTRSKAKRALKRLRTIAHTLIRELMRKLPSAVIEREQAQFDLYLKVLSQQPKDKNKIYSLHEPDVYCVGKGKDHKPYEYGRKASIVSTLEHNIIVGVVSHDEHVHDSKTLASALAHAKAHRQTPIAMAVVDRGYRGAKQYVTEDVLLPNKPLKRDTQYQKQKKRRLCQKRAGIEPIIGHLKHDYRLCRNWLKGSEGDKFNLLMAACAWNLRKWMIAFFLFENQQVFWALLIEIRTEYATVKIMMAE